MLFPSEIDFFFHRLKEWRRYLSAVP